MRSAWCCTRCSPGAHPFPGTSLNALLDQHLHHPIPSVRRRATDLPPAVDAAIARATAKDAAGAVHRRPRARAAFRAALEGDARAGPAGRRDAQPVQGTAGVPRGRQRGLLRTRAADAPTDRAAGGDRAGRGSSASSGRPAPEVLGRPGRPRAGDPTGRDPRAPSAGTCRHAPRRPSRCASSSRRCSAWPSTRRRRCSTSSSATSAGSSARSTRSSPTPTPSS